MACPSYYGFDTPRPAERITLHFLSSSIAAEDIKVGAKNVVIAVNNNVVALFAFEEKVTLYRIPDSWRRVPENFPFTAGGREQGVDVDLDRAWHVPRNDWPCPRTIAWQG
jgi:hypothetical protein